MKTLHSKLFIQYSALILLILVIFLGIIYAIYGDTLMNNAHSEFQADCDNIATILDSQVEHMNLLSKNIVSSKTLQNLFIQDLYSDDISTHTRKMQFSNSLFDIIKLSFDNKNLNIMDTSGRFIHIGSSSRFQKYPSDYFLQLPWFNMTLKENGKQVLLPPYCSDYSDSSEPVISLCRAFAPENPLNETAVLEIQLKYSYIDQIIQNSIHNKKNTKQIFVFDQSGHQIYPYEKAPRKKIQSYIMHMLNSKNESKNHNIMIDNETLFVYKTLTNADWTVFVTAPAKNVFSNFYLFRFIAIVSFFIIFILTLFVTYKIAKNLTDPIKKLEQTVSSLSLVNLDSGEPPMYNSGFQELDSLEHSFEQMRKNLQNSLQDAVDARTVAIEAKLLALQSQMNPHFLYNALASISILAEENESQKVIDICNDLSMLLRYISSNSGHDVQLWQELEYTQSYIRIMKIKYEERIQFHIDVDDALLSLRIPKLIIQPLVENCTKYALNIDPPWSISIIGTVINDKWMIQVKDNGPGFTQEYLNNFSKHIEAINSSNHLPDLSINGMGIYNLYTRMSLLYKENLIFKLENHQNAGACVTIGGPMYSKETNYE